MKTDDLRQAFLAFFDDAVAEAKKEGFEKAVAQFRAFSESNTTDPTLSQPPAGDSGNKDPANDEILSPDVVGERDHRLESPDVEIHPASTQNRESPSLVGLTNRKAVKIALLTHKGEGGTKKTLREYINSQLRMPLSERAVLDVLRYYSDRDEAIYQDRRWFPTAKMVDSSVAEQSVTTH